MKIYYIANARMPTDKAHGIQIAKMCEAFLELGVPLELVVSNRGSGSLKEAYNLTHEIPLRRLPVLDLQFLGPVGYRLTASLFALESLLFLWMKVFVGERFLIYTIDMDSFSFGLLALVPRPLFAEIHSIKKPGFLRRYFFKRAHIIATNTLIGGELAHTFNIPPVRLCIEPNGVDESVLHTNFSQKDARAKLHLPPDETFALYVGRIYAWKGLEILADATLSSTLPMYVVGGTREEYESVTKKSGKTLRFVEVQPHSEIPLWLAAADIVLVLGTAQNEDSYRYTAPMKIFEYFAARRATVAARTPAIESIVPDGTVHWYEPDDARSLANAIQEAYTSSTAEDKMKVGYALATKHTWRKRAERIKEFLEQTKLTIPSALTRVLLIIGVALVLFFASFHLFNSPETWMDEGLIIQSAIGLMHTGKAALPVSPGVFEPAWYITTSYPVTVPLAAVFSLFGVSLEAARLVMWTFLIGFFGVLAFYTRKSIGGIAAWFGFFLIVFFAPVYGDGRNVLGEIPGLLFMLLALLPLVQQGALTRKRAISVGLFAGLAVATKPVFVLFLPALLLALVLRYKELQLQKVFIYGVIGVLVPCLVWIYLQFGNVTASSVFAVYVNPHDVAIGNAVVANIKRVFTEIQPLYFLLALFFWGVSYVVRRARGEVVAVTEEVLLFFSILVLLAYLRTVGYYRYFFIGQVFSVLYLPQAVLYLTKNYGKFISRAILGLLCGLLMFQAYETTFRSWTAVHYDSSRTEVLENYFAQRPASEDVYIYQAPEMVSFAWGHPLYQYAEITPSIHFGEKLVPAILAGQIPRLYTSIDYYEAHRADTFSRYVISGRLDNYVILKQKTK